jgi:hypothetical protein
LHSGSGNYGEFQIRIQIKKFYFWNLRPPGYLSKKAGHSAGDSPMAANKINATFQPTVTLLILDVKKALIKSTAWFLN